MEDFARTRREPRCGRLATATLAAALAVGLASAAHAQLGETLGGLAGDTELTPVPKAVGEPGPASQWAVMAGARFGGDGKLFDDSPTPYTVDFFSTAFSPPETDPNKPPAPLVGFFAGAQCKDEATPFDELEDCEREPAIYQLAEDERGDLKIEQVPEVGGGSGFVGAVAWIDPYRALAVGGTGTYPRREPATPVDTPGYTDPAGDARAWLYDDHDADGDAEWRELNNEQDPEEGFTGQGGDEIPDEMAGMTALACGQVELVGHCLAGGLQRLWWWRPANWPAPPAPEGFRAPPVVDVENAAGQPDFHFRVRAIRFVPFALADSDNPSIIVATSGCCAASGGSPAGPRILFYNRAKNRWRSDEFTTDPDSISGSLQTSIQNTQANIQNTPRNPLSIGGWNTYISNLRAGISTPDTSTLGGDAQRLSPGRAASEAAGGTSSAVLADSYYGLATSDEKAAVIASPGGPPVAGNAESGSRIISLDGGVVKTSARDWSRELAAGLTARSLDSVRLLAADGDFTGLPTPGNEIAGQPGSDWEPGPDTLPDWSVGRLKDSELGVAYTTNPALVPVPNPLSCTIGSASTFPGRASSCSPMPESLTEANTESRRLVGMGTYTLNAIAFVPVTEGAEAWAAGDRGALARLGGSGSVGSQNEPPAPFIRSRSATPLAEREPFDLHRPTSTARPGVVPPLTDQPLESLEEPALVPYGSANPMPASAHSTFGFAMARDGSEGWAIGRGDAYHFDGERWVRCDQGALPPADEACASLLKAGGGSIPRLWAIARIPLERDADPRNDKEFAAMALGSQAVIYHRGSWQHDPNAPTGSESSELRIAFRAPDDGWLTISTPNSSSLLHYSGGEWPDGQWHDCGTADSGGSFNVEKCGEGVSLLPLGLSGRSLQPQFAGETLFLAGTRIVGSGGQGADYPFVATREPGPSGSWRMDYDPGCPESQTEPPPTTKPTCSGSPDAQELGTVRSFSVVQLGPGRVAGWLMGHFGPAGTRFQVDTLDATRALTGQRRLMRRDPASGKWELRTVEDAAADFLSTGIGGARVMSFTQPGGTERSVIIPGESDIARHPWLTYDSERDRWRVLRTPFVSNLKFGAAALARQTGVLASDPDGQGGFLAAVSQGLSLRMPGEPQRGAPTFYYHYTDRAPKAVFEDAPHPIREPISAIDGTADGTLWVSTYSNNLYRYDRIGGWERAPIPGWDPGRAVARRSAAYALAVSETGVGVAVGEEGRIADISPDSVRLDPASGRRCSDDPTPPCGTPQDLRAAAVAPDGSALVGGDNLALMWRPAGGDFRLAGRPPISATTRIADITMPAPGTAWLATDAGEIWAGTLAGSEWRWTKESAASAAADETGWSQLNAIEVDALGRGLAVGDSGAVLERSSNGSWQRLNTGYLDDLYSVALPPSGYSDGTLVGGGVGVVLTRVNESFHLARPSDIFDPITNGHGATMAARIVGVAIAGGDSEGEVEAWAASQLPVEAYSRRDPPPGALLHYASGDDPLLDPNSRAGALPDTPTPQPGELTLAAFGRSECQLSGRTRFCPEFQGSNMFSEVVTRQIQDEVSARAAETQGGLAALFTGDINSAPGREEQWGRSLSVVGRPNTPLDVNATHNTWRDLVAEPLAADGVPIFAALGRADLSGVSECVNPVTCPGTRDVRDIADASLSVQWRHTFAQMPSPWGTGSEAKSESLDLDPVGGSLLAEVEAPGGGARTHYAADIVRDGERIARLVVVDNSLGSLAESAVNQNPVEEQQSWLENVLCFDGSATDTDGDVRDCTRKVGQEAVVLANYPTYTYATNISPTDLATDGAAFETTLLRNSVDALITGRLGWNGLYYACAPGLHYPAPGQGYPKRAPKGLAECIAAAGGADAPDELAELSSKATDTVSGTPTGALPVLVASGAGGRFGPRGDLQGSASEGLWRGYGVVRVDPDTGEVTVEQRPVLDWVGLTSPKHVLDPGERVELHGYGREPAAIDVSLRYIEIDSPAVTHRYDLLLADPDQPWLPCLATDADCAKLAGRLEGPRSLGSASGEAARSARDDSSSLSSRAQASRSDAVAEGSGPGNPCDPYVCLPESVATIDDQSGEVRAGNGKHPGTYAIAMLSMGDHVATQPLFFKKSPSFIVFAAFGLPELPSPPTSATTAPAPPPPPTPSQPNVPQPTVPEVPPPPPVPPIAAADPPEPQPPAPPAPPPPTEQPAPLDLTISPTALTVATPAAVIQPPTPPVNPAPPSGARREARQRQAATQKSGAGSEALEEGVSRASDETRAAGGDAGGGPRPVQGASMTRRDVPGPNRNAYTRASLDPARTTFTPLEREQPSAWARGLLYSGGITMAALILALGMSRASPTPRRRAPQIPAPAQAQLRRRP